MLLTSVIVILREVLEASLLIAILVALSTQLSLMRRWILGGLGIGAAGALLYNLNIDTVSDWLDGVGQEIVSASLQISVYVFLVSIALLGARRVRHPDTGTHFLPVLMALAIGLAITHEGFEIVVYLYGFSDTLAHFASVFAGTLMGATIGISVGVLLYYFLIAVRPGASTAVAILLLALVGAALLSQATLMLIQADWLPSSLPLWDTSDWLPEASLSGQLLYVLIGYEATPTLIQAICYFGGLLVLLVPAALIGSHQRQLPGEGTHHD